MTAAFVWRWTILRVRCLFMRFLVPRGMDHHFSTIRGQAGQLFHKSCVRTFQRSSVFSNAGEIRTIPLDDPHGSAHASASPLRPTSTKVDTDVGVTRSSPASSRYSPHFCRGQRSEEHLTRSHFRNRNILRQATKQDDCGTRSTAWRYPAPVAIGYPQIDPYPLPLPPDKPVIN
jgi:hypothetical protein